MRHELNNLGKFQADEGSYNRIQDIYPSVSEESKPLKPASRQNNEICTVKKDGFGQEMILRNNLHTDVSVSGSPSSKGSHSPSSLRSSSGLFDASRGESLKKLLDRKRAN
jgi:hypothetical protein